MAGRQKIAPPPWLKTVKQPRRRWVRRSPTEEHQIAQDESETFLQRHLFLVVSSVIFSVAGVVYALLYFPELPVFQAIFGGVVFGVFCAMCVAGHRLIR